MACGQGFWGSGGLCFDIFELFTELFEELIEIILVRVRGLGVRGLGLFKGDGCLEG